MKMLILGLKVQIPSDLHHREEEQRLSVLPTWAVCFGKLDSIVYKQTLLRNLIGLSPGHNVAGSLFKAKENYIENRNLRYSSSVGIVFVLNKYLVHVSACARDESCTE